MSTIGHWIEELRAELGHLSSKIDPLLTLLEVAQAATGVGGASAATALKVIASAFDAFAGMQAGTMTHDELVATLEQLKVEMSTRIPEIEAEQDAALAEKFPAEGK